MTTPSGGGPARRESARIVVTMRAGDDVLVLLGAATALAGALGVGLAGLFVEEPELLRVAALPVTLEVGGSSGAVRALDAATTRLLLDRRTDLARRAVERAAAQLDVPWSFRVECGPVVEVAFGAVVAPDVVLVPPLRSAAARAVGGQAARHSRGVVGAVVDGSAAGERALDAALALAGGRVADVALVVPGAGDASGARRAAARRLGLTPALPGTVDLGDPYHRPRLRALVVPAGVLGGSTQELGRLAAAVDGPVLVVP